MCFILFYSFKHDLNSYDILGKLKKCVLEGMVRFLLDFLHKPNSCMLQSGLGMLVAPQGHGGGLVPEISTPDKVLCSCCMWPK